MRRRKPITILAAVMAWLLVASTALAVVTIEGNNVFGNGHAITIDRDETTGHTRVSSSEAGAVSDDVGSRDVSGYDVYGGSNGKNINEDTSVTVNGGTVGDVYGGGLNGDVNGSTNVTVNDGTTGDVYGGGHAVGENGGSSDHDGENGDADVTDNTNVTINGGTTGDVYGGGHAEGGDADGRGINDDISGGDADATVEDNTNVTVNGGSTGNVYGGGHAQGGDADGRSNNDYVSGGDAEAVVEDHTNVSINGGTVNGNVYGSGRGDSGEEQGGGTNDGYADAYVEDNSNVTISGGTVTGIVTSGGKNVDGDSDSWTRAYGENTVNIEGGRIEGKKVYVEGDDYENTLRIKHPSGLYYTYYIRDVWFFDLDIENDIVDNYKFEVVDVKGGYHIYQFKNVPQPKSKTVNFVYKFNGTQVFSETKSVTMNFWDSTVTLSSSWPGNANLNSASGSQDVTYNGADSITKEITVMPKTKTGTVTFNYLYNGVTHFTENKTGTVAYGAGEITLSSTWGGNDNVNGSSGSGKVSFAAPTKTVDIIITPKTKTGTVTFNYLYNGVTHFTENKTGTVTYGAGEITLSSTWGGNDNVNGGSGSGKVSFATPTKTVDIIVTPQTKTGTVTFNYVYNGVTHFTENKTGTVTYGAAPITLTSTWGGNDNVGGGSGSGEVSFAEPTKVIDITVAPNTKTGTVTFNYVYNGVTHFTENKTGTVTYGAAPITLSSTWDGNDNVGGGSGSGEVSFAEPTKVVDITVAPNTKTGTVTFNYVYNGVTHFTENKTGTVTYGAAPITLTSTWGGNDNVGGGSGSGTVSFAEPTKVVDITVAPNTKTGTVTFNYMYNGIIHFTENKTDTVTYGAAPITLTSTWDGDYNVYGGSGSGEVSFAEPTKEVNITVEPKSATAMVRFIYLYRTTVVSVDEQSVDLTYGDPDKTVTPAPFSVRGYYLLAPVSPVTVNFESTLEQEVAVIEVEVQLGVVDDDDDDEEIPLGPGIGQTGIPLGVPSTGDSTGISILLIALGAAVVTFVAAKAKRSSVK